MKEKYLTQFVKEALAEDVGPGDFTSEACIPEDARSHAQLLVKDVGVIAGVEVAEFIFRYLDPQMRFECHKPDGSDVNEGEVVFDVYINTRALLKGERLCLNTMQRMSGIATLSNHFQFETEGTGVTVLDTRKTTPLLRFLEKWAVRLGGCQNYRFGLYDRFMIKDNHIDAAGGLSEAIQRVLDFRKEKKLEHLAITVEVRNLEELFTALDLGGFDRILFDNFEIPLLAEAVEIVAGRFETEASGGITVFNVREYAETGVDYVSSGALTHSATPLDLSLKVVAPI
ncbi:MAG TPA: carboxylating nicotinate-nucleotide diphosphorylase [Phaeodactylibacter sp.]|nr:carboxylating nicotinate-nucleotide diphosphorylase [Phaeodactylibacter sp.]